MQKFSICLQISRCTPEQPAMCSRSNIFRRFTRCDRFYAHGQECAQKQNSGAPKLSGNELFVENPGGESHRNGGTKKLKGLCQRDSDLVDRYIIQNMCERDAADSGDN